MIPPQEPTEGPISDIPSPEPVDLDKWQEFWLDLTGDYEAILSDFDLAA